MPFEALAVAALLAASTLPLVLHVRRVRANRTGLAFLVWGLGVLGMAWAASDAPNPIALRTKAIRPLEVDGDGYVSSQTCKPCHPDQYDSWETSYHQSMAQLATPETVLAPWDGILLTDLPQRGGSTYRLYRRGDEFWVDMDDPEWRAEGAPPRVQRQLVQTTGSHHNQLYWVATGNGRKLSLLPHCWRVEEGHWTSIDAIFLTPPRGVQRTGVGRWNSSCQRCHATHGKPRFRDVNDMDTHVTELGIACEMCHGPAEEHAQANRDPRRRYAQHGSEEHDDTIVNPEDLTAERSSQVCGQCHSLAQVTSQEDRERWIWEGFRYRPGDDLMATRHLRTSGDTNFWADGQLRTTGREYGALVRTPCFQAGEMSCLSCHRMHPGPDDPRPRTEWANDYLEVGMGGDRACTQCHDEYTEPEKLVAHSHHELESTGSRCLECHMPHTSYGLLGAIRNHEVTADDVQTTLATGRPNACNQCHLDQTLAWTAKHLEDWYGIEAPALDGDEQDLAASVLWTLQGDAGQRALMAWSFGWDSALAASGPEANGWIDPLLAILMNDPYHAVRYIAWRTARERPAFRGIPFDFLAPEEERLAVIQRAVGGWGRTEPAPALLVDGNGEWMQAVADRLLADRDESDIVLQE